MRDQVQRVLDTLRQPRGLYVASPSNTYHYIWIRDISYIALSELHRDNGRFEETYYGLLDILRKYEWKLTYHATKRPVETYEYIHPRYTADTLEEVNQPWGNAQNDAIGAFLFGIGEGLRRGKKMLRDERDRKMIQLLVQYLTTLEYWMDEDNGMWEENRERHASSIGACAAGLLAIQPYFDVPWEPIQAGLSALFQLLPRESATKECDLALLSLVYPYELVPRAMREVIINRVEERLLRQSGVIRYEGDLYYQEDGKEAEWCMGLPWLGLCHATIGNMDKAQSYLTRTVQVMAHGAKIPELYVMHRRQPNENTPLGWSHALWLVLFDTISSGKTAHIFH
ncbi:glycoside hydrolase family 15 protein [Alicyclobacillus dauci]|uniref:Glycoside hydrolase family 15 protein n=1 Tax=Alicyclobacillus dauci TaxID=1475485 RepID=A0ABY6Z4H7_9BACL|nr:glycoside hydrolase family 15 protein [Alicyclobacillus dauci]WAH37660.1 glycoside hydrolase family 15 protein [Alicyclobacillus dauci]